MRPPFVVALLATIALGLVSWVGGRDRHVAVPPVPWPDTAPAVTAPPPAAGCGIVEPAAARPLRRRTAAPPARPIPFFARRPQGVPGSVAPIVAGVRLPKGSQCPRHWTSDAPLPGGVAVASALAAAFPRTGLWPLLWRGDDPDTYFNENGFLRAADRLDAAAVLRRSSARNLGGRRFAGMAAAPRGAARNREPFAALERDLPATDAPAGGWVLILVPVHRPADVISVLSPFMTELITDDGLTAVLRSWEERFGAVPVAMEPGVLYVAAGRRPGAREAMRLAAEHLAFAPEDGSFDGAGLGPRATHLRRHDLWSFGWPD